METEKEKIINILKVFTNDIQERNNCLIFRIKINDNKKLVGEIYYKNYKNNMFIKLLYDHDHGHGCIIQKKIISQIVCIKELYNFIDIYNDDI